MYKKHMHCGRKGFFAEDVLWSLQRYTTMERWMKDILNSLAPKLVDSLQRTFAEMFVAKVTAKLLEGFFMDIYLYKCRIISNTLTTILYTALMVISVCTWHTSGSNHQCQQLLTGWGKFTTRHCHRQLMQVLIRQGLAKIEIEEFLLHKEGEKSTWMPSLYKRSPSTLNSPFLGIDTNTNAWELSLSSSHYCNTHPVISKTDSIQCLSYSSMVHGKHRWETYNSNM